MKKGGSQNRTESQAGSASRRSSIESIFPNRTLLDALSLLLLHPGEKFYQREIAERTGMTPIEIQRALRHIEAAGLATKVRRGNRVSIQ